MAFVDMVLHSFLRIRLEGYILAFGLEFGEVLWELGYATSSLEADVALHNNS